MRAFEKRQIKEKMSGISWIYRLDRDRPGVFPVRVIDQLEPDVEWAEIAHLDSCAAGRAAGHACTIT
jgi:hypothetical protein